MTFGSTRLYGPEHRVCYGAEPLSLIIKAAQMANVAVTLFRALRHDSARDRATEIKRIISQDENFKMGPRICIEPDGSEAITGVLEMPTFVEDVYIGMQPEPSTPSQYDQVAIGGIAFLTDRLLASEFKLCWSQTADGSKRLGLGWIVNSLLAALYLKLGYALRENRCKVCGVPITNRKEKAKTCGPTCRKRLQRASSHK
jgi:hypothetical protein